jgi:teichoic acid glycerol-phosphate primase
MARELAIELYLFIFKALFSVFRLFPLKKKTAFVVSFGDNARYILDEMNAQGIEGKRIILKGNHSRADFKGDGKTIVFHFEIKHLLHYLLSIYHLATSKVVIIDNYFGFLSAISFRPSVTCVQVWHAAGAVKQFGLKDPSAANRSPRAKERFQRVYNQFHYVVSGSDTMSGIFKASFGLPGENILSTGVPRTDFFFDEEKKSVAYQSLLGQFPGLEEKRTILYAPTFRENELKTSSIGLDIQELYDEFHQEEYVLLLKLHPAVSGEHELEKQFPGFVYDLTNYHDVNEILLITDLLITDYSSIPFEYAFLEKPMIFFAYDLEHYEKERGFWEDYETQMPGPVVFSTQEIIEKIKTPSADYSGIKRFKEKWNEYSDGNSSKKLVDFLFKK